jgi:hypothetical protein
MGPEPIKQLSSHFEVMMRLQFRHLPSSILTFKNSILINYNLYHKSKQIIL